MAMLILAGAGWGMFNPNGLSAQQTRLVLTSVVFYFFLPAMVLLVLWQAQIGWLSLQYTLLGVTSIAVSLILCWLVIRLFRIKNRQSGALILAAAFPNVTYLGLPILEQVYGSWSRSVVIQIDLFSVAPVVYTIGVMLARHYGEDPTEKRKSMLAFLNAPPFWAAFLAVTLNLMQVTVPDWLIGFLQKCSSAVAPLMIFSLGMALNWKAIRFGNLPYVIPVVCIKLFAMPAVAMLLASKMSMGAEYRSAAVLDIAMPSMILGIVLCDRYKLDSSLYATSVAITTGLSVFSLPFWYGIL
jgi:predicted permease